MNQVLDLDDPSPTQLHPTQKSYQPLYHQARYTQSLGGQLPIPGLVGAAPYMGGCCEEGWEGSLVVSYVYMTQCAKVTYCGCILL